MLTSFRSFIIKNELLLPQDKTLLAISGGVDSVVMAHLFHQAKLPFAIAHCNFRLRSADADADEQWVRALASQYAVDFHVHHFDTLPHAQEQGISIQMAARDLRYAWFRDICASHNFAKLATAHHLNDGLETALLNFTKGTGIAGLKGISPLQGLCIRPLLFAHKEQIIAYARHEGLSWREDSSNAKNDYQRNLLRNRVVPLLKDINPNIEHTFRDTAERLRQTGALLQSLVADYKKRMCRQEGEHFYITTHELDEHPAAGVILWELTKPFGFHFSTIQDLWERRSSAGTYRQSASHQLCVDRLQWIITPTDTASSDPVQFSLNATTTHLKLPIGTLQCAHMTLADHSLTNTTQKASLDRSKLSFPLTVRKWRPGDFFCPLGMRQRKKISDFLVDTKVPRPLKQQVWVVTSNDAIVWVVGHRIDDRFKLTADTHHVYTLNLKPASTTTHARSTRPNTSSPSSTCSTYLQRNSSKCTR